jgi:hypothetical protein
MDILSAAGGLTFLGILLVFAFALAVFLMYGIRLQRPWAAMT